jgi:hypothetical protein
VSENRLLRRIFGPKREELTGIWRTFHNKELHNFTVDKYYRGDKMKENEIGVSCSINEKRNAYKVLIGESDGKWLIGRSGHR